MIYLVITDERVLSGITGNTYNSSNQSHVMVIICFIVLIRLVTNENFLTLAIISFITLILLLALFIALSPLSVFATLSDFFILVVFLVIQIIESHKSEYRAKQLFWRKTKEEDACSPSSSLMDDEKKKESSQVNTEIELLVESCDKIKQYIKTATAVIMFKDVKAKLKLAQNEVEKIKRKIAHSTIRDKFKLDFGEELDEQDKEFVRTHYMNSNVNQELRASIRRMTLNDIFEKNKVFPASEFGLKELDGVLSTIGKD